MIRIQVVTVTLCILHAIEVEAIESDHLERRECARAYNTESLM